MSDSFETVKAMETALASKEVRSDRHRLSELIHDDFQEFGKSGRVYDKTMILNDLPEWEYIETKLFDFNCVELAHNVILVRYKSKVDREHANRSSVWVKENGHWQLIHHQGTNCDE